MAMMTVMIMVMVDDFCHDNDNLEFLRERPKMKITKPCLF